MLTASLIVLWSYVAAAPSAYDVSHRQQQENACCRYRKTMFDGVLFCSSFQLTEKQEQELKTQYERSVKNFPAYLTAINHNPEQAIKPGKELLVCIADPQTADVRDTEVAYTNRNGLEINLSREIFDSAAYRYTMAHEMAHYLYENMLKKYDSTEYWSTILDHNKAEAQAKAFEKYYRLKLENTGESIP